jgi:hypothetical protein
LQLADAADTEIAVIETVDMGKLKLLPAIPMMRKGIIAQSTSVAACNCRASRAVHLAPRDTAGATITRGFGWIMDAVRILQSVDAVGTETADTDKPKLLPAIPMLRKGTTAQRTPVLACNCRASRVVHLAPKAIVGVTTSSGFGWITDAGLSLRWVAAPATKTVITTTAMTKAVMTETSEADQPKPLPVIPMMRRDITAQPILVAASNYRASKAVHLAPKATVGVTTTSGFGWIMDAAPILRYVADAAERDSGDPETTPLHPILGFARRR